MNGFDLSTISDVYIGSIEASEVYLGNTLIWTKSGEHNYSRDYFTIESLLDSNTILIYHASSSPAMDKVLYSLDNGATWTTIPGSWAGGATLSVATINSGETLLLKQNDRSFWASNWNAYNEIKGTKNFKVYGNVMSLINGDNFRSNSEFASGSSYNLCGLFYGTTTLVDASNLIIPATTLYTSSYNGMFRGCTNLVNGPKLLPALNVPIDGYSSMFEGCVKLVEAPEIMATTVSGATALNRMFCMNRNSKVTAAMTKGPVLRITNPSSYTNVYLLLFCGNGSLTEVTILAQGTSLSFTNWLNNVSSTGTIKKLSATTLTSGTSGLPSGWTTLTYSE